MNELAYSLAPTVLQKLIKMGRRILRCKSSQLGECGCELQLGGERSAKNTSVDATELVGGVS